ncbi:hypothetical protein MBLNU459_g0569t1 [Dothideomycetes sp. NU459]
MVHKLCISSMSLGRAWVHDLPGKLDQAARYGYEGIELFYEDLEYHAKTLPGGATHENQVLAAEEIRQMCAERNITIINLQPFAQYDGLRDRSRHDERIQELHRWFELAATLGTDLIQVPACFLPKAECTGDVDVIVGDLQQIADLGLQQSPPIRFVYESLCWSTHIDTWEKCWDVVSRVDRPNFGICLDTYNIAGRIYADPTSPDGKTADAEAATAASMARLVETIDVAKVFFVQIVDAERLDAPLVDGHPFHVAEQPPRMSWSRNCRLFYGEQDRGAYLPIKQITQAFIHGLGFQGWVSHELFNRSMADPSPDTPAEHARRGAVSWAKMVQEIPLSPSSAFVAAKKVPAQQQQQQQHQHQQRVKTEQPQMLSLL